MPTGKSKDEKRASEQDSAGSVIFLALSLLILSATAFAVAYLSLAKEISPLYRSVLSRTWSRAEGKIVKHTESTKSVRAGSAKNPGSATVYVPKVSYAFQIGGETFTGERMNFTAEEKYFSTVGESREFLASSYPVNANVEVFYDSSDPRESTLSREYVYEFGDYQAGCCCGSLGILFSLLFWLSVKDSIKIFRKRKK
jgi:hypothetical protein